mgnify:CR=1 FL=1
MQSLAEPAPGDQWPAVLGCRLRLSPIHERETGEVSVSDTRIGQRYSMRMPNGETVTVTLTPEVMATSTRVINAMRDGRKPDPHDLAVLFAYLSEDT